MHHWELDWRKHYVPLEDVPTVEKNEESFFDDQISSGSQNLIPTESHQSLDPTVLPQPIDGSVDRDLPDSDLEIEIESNASTVPSPSSSGSLRLRIKNSFRKLKEPRVGHKRL
uniref:Uncharacterized protein n=1 Tax=Kwoniella pini CBS 10737 TaxID=1296096 RepID=A0A1B9HVT9_9TREE|nr:uncharacterized protein I206_06275 [Kwoniella pini CBS 10737]OCF47379.1 hypothetical protein I206_06275 [Kwoniella pini CBS 10737]